jgi:hypothetical protein
MFPILGIHTLEEEMLVGQLKRSSLKRPFSSGGTDGETTIIEVRKD